MDPSTKTLLSSLLTPAQAAERLKANYTALRAKILDLNERGIEVGFKTQGVWWLDESDLEILRRRSPGIPGPKPKDR